MKYAWIFLAAMFAACSLDQEGTALFPSNDAGDGDVQVPPDGSWPDVNMDADGEAEASLPDAGPDAVFDAEEDQDADAPPDAFADVVADVVEDAVTDVQLDAPVDVVQDAPVDTGTTNCLTKGIRVRWKPPTGSVNSPIVQANGAVSNPNDFKAMCTASQDLDPDPYIFDCCFTTTSAPKNTLVYFDFVLMNSNHACGISGCPVPFSQYAVWADGKLLVDYAVTFLPGCQVAGSCPYVLQATIPP